MQLLLALLAMLASLLGLAGRDEAGVLPYAGGNAEPISSPEIIDYRNRSFDPATGRFLQRDPVLGGDELFNPYCFPGNNPVTNADPMGDREFTPSEEKNVEALEEFIRKAEELIRNKKNLAARIQKETIDELKTFLEEYKRAIAEDRQYGDDRKLVVLDEALKRWREPQLRATYASSDNSRDVIDWRAYPKCNYFVNETLVAAGMEEPAVCPAGEGVEPRRPLAGEWANNRVMSSAYPVVKSIIHERDAGKYNENAADLASQYEAGTYGEGPRVSDETRPRVGDVIAFGVPSIRGGTNHVGIIITEKIYISARNEEDEYGREVADVFGQRNVQIKDIPYDIEDVTIRRPQYTYFGKKDKEPLDYVIQREHELPDPDRYTEDADHVDPFTLGRSVEQRK
jgi:RHS repeat-associated protein